MITSATSLRIFLAATAAMAVLALAPIALGEAGAASGGLGPGAAENGGEAGRQPENAKYTRLWNGTSGAERRWARRTSECESGGDPKAIGGGGLYRGAFQFMRSTWKSSPRSPGGDPIDYSYRTQAVVAVLLKRRDGAGHWPVCG